MDPADNSAVAPTRVASKNKKKKRRRLMGGGAGSRGGNSSESEMEYDSEGSAADAAMDDFEEPTVLSNRTRPAKTSAGERNPMFLDDKGNAGGNDNKDDSDGEDIIENAERDYRAMPELDRLDEEDLDNEEYGEMDANARRAAERFMQSRDRQMDAARSRVPIALQDLDDDDEEDEQDPNQRRRRQEYERAAFLVDDDAQEQEEQQNVAIELENFNVPLHQWIARREINNEVKRRFRNFLGMYTRNGRTSSTTNVYQPCAPPTSRVLSFLTRS